MINRVELNLDSVSGHISDMLVEIREKRAYIEPEGVSHLKETLSRSFIEGVRIEHRISLE